MYFGIIFSRHRSQIYIPFIHPFLLFIYPAQIFEITAKIFYCFDGHDEIEKLFEIGTIITHCSWQPGTSPWKHCWCINMASGLSWYGFKPLCTPSSYQSSSHWVQYRLCTSISARVHSSLFHRPSPLLGRKLHCHILSSRVFRFCPWRRSCLLEGRCRSSWFEDGGNHCPGKIYSYSRLWLRMGIPLMYQPIRGYLYMRQSSKS